MKIIIWCAHQLKKVCMYTQMYKTREPLCRWMASGCIRVTLIQLEGWRTPVRGTQEVLSSLKGMGKWNWLGFLRWHSFILVNEYFSIKVPAQTIRRFVLTSMKIDKWSDKLLTDIQFSGGGFWLQNKHDKWWRRMEQCGGPKKMDWKYAHSWGRQRYKILTLH